MLKRKDLEQESSTGNVFADVGLTDAGDHLIKAGLVIRIDRIIRQRKLTQAAAALLLIACLNLANLSIAKFGIRSGDAVCLLDAPRDMPAALGDLPVDITLSNSPPAAVILFFVTDPHELRQQLSELRSFAAKTKLWVCWKKGKAVEGGVSERLVRETGISLGLVDYKICSVSEVWSGLLFAAKTAKKK